MNFFPAAVTPAAHGHLRPGQCRKRVLKQLKKLPPPSERPVGREAVLRAWLVSRCQTCRACLPR
jgi:hypothetical protein